MVVWARQIVRAENPGQEDWEGYTPVFLRDGLQVLDNRGGVSEPHISLMFDEPQAFDSVQDMLNNGEFGVVAWEDETTYQFVDVSELENVRVSNYVYRGVVIEKETPVEPILGLAPIRTKTDYVAAYSNKLVVRNKQGAYYAAVVGQTSAQQFVQNDLKFQQVLSTEVSWAMPISSLRNEDSSQIVVGVDTIDYDEVPGDDTFVFLTELAYLQV